MSLAPTAIIYFKPAAGDMAKDLAARVRNDPRGIKTLLCWGTQFRDERDLQGCQAVMIQRSLPNSALIATCYENFAAGVEIHYLNDDGSFEDDGDGPGSEAVKDTEGEALGPDAAGAVGTGLRRREEPDRGPKLTEADRVRGDAEKQEQIDAGKPGPDNQPAAEGQAAPAADTGAGDAGEVKPDAPAA